MKKFLSFLLVIAVVMSFGTIAMTSVSAEENDDLVSVAAADDAVSVGAGTDVADTGSSGKVYFTKPDKWSGTIVYCHIWEVKGGDSFFNWQMKKEKCEEEGGKFAYNLATLDDASSNISGGMKSNVDYNIMFSDNNGNETCGLMFNTHCIGDTVKVVDTTGPSFENAVDSTKKSWEISWTTNATKYGIPLQITSVGTIQGTFISPDNTPDDILKTWDKDYKSYPNDQSYSPQSSARDHATRAKEIKAEFAKMVSEGKVLLIGGGVYTESSSSSGGSKPGSSSKPSGSSSYVTSDGKEVTVDKNGNYVDKEGNIVDASEVTEVDSTATVSTGESTTYVFVTFGVMLAAAGVYFLTRKKKA
ncbi:MAG: LPXTG cell wall anchor domain-containing protein [Oscillospiraceae bacterium]|nr:LPXTG cell wall anchor domain-containing protein [Oscillospiraceae bacterium]